MQVQAPSLDLSHFYPTNPGTITSRALVLHPPIWAVVLLKVSTMDALSGPWLTVLPLSPLWGLWSGCASAGLPSPLYQWFPAVAWAPQNPAHVPRECLGLPQMRLLTEMKRRKNMWREGSHMLEPRWLWIAGGTGVQEMKGQWQLLGSCWHYKGRGDQPGRVSEVGREAGQRGEPGALMEEETAKDRGKENREGKCPFVLNIKEGFRGERTRWNLVLGAGF